jgi:hypothetical protein
LSLGISRDIDSDSRHLLGCFGAPPGFKKSVFSLRFSNRSRRHGAALSALIERPLPPLPKPGVATKSPKNTKARVLSHYGDPVSTRRETLGTSRFESGPEVEHRSLAPSLMASVVLEVGTVGAAPPSKRALSHRGGDDL